LALDIGCGEGRTTRDLSRRRHPAIGIDASASLVAYAKEAEPEGRYVVGDAAQLPFGDSMFDLAVAYNSLMDVDDMPRSVAEATRVLRAGGRLCLCIVHPLADAGRFVRREADAPFLIEGSYLTKRLFDGTLERSGLSMRFQSWSYPLEHYALAFEAAGLLIEALREPAVPNEAVVRDPAERRWQRLPNFLFLRLLKPPDS
jgi:SAM-dependent methyltransferase